MRADSEGDQRTPVHDEEGLVYAATRRTMAVGFAGAVLATWLLGNQGAGLAQNDAPAPAAQAATGNVAEAEAHRELFQEARAKVPDTRRVHNNTVIDLLEVADAMIDGELEYRRSRAVASTIDQHIDPAPLFHRRIDEPPEIIVRLVRPGDANSAEVVGERLAFSGR